MNKTNALRMLDTAGIPYETVEYDPNGPLDGVSVAQSIGEDVDHVYKTLVTVGASGKNYVFCLPVNQTLDLKKCAKAVNEKNIEMIPQKTLLPLTGYIHGGCSPVGMKKPFETTIQEDCILIDDIYVSAGKIGMQMHLKVEDLIKITSAKLADFTKEKEL